MSCTTLLRLCSYHQPGDGICPALSAADLSLAIGEGAAEVTVEFADIVLQCCGLDYAAEARYYSLCRSPAVHHPNHPVRP